ncbi:probable cardiolipin synthase (CMP-forming) [Aplysia californica]|uniref:cardiolipin synthase (CMP-forming) n=1 Tax=Aplysia californica TaxID=6500 RepID=A0ABM0K063_APLCA|nr:probable cardiolipin synthase (CMP-forming) [Aplysia californica]
MAFLQPIRSNALSSTRSLCLFTASQVKIKPGTYLSCNTRSTFRSRSSPAHHASYLHTMLIPQTVNVRSLHINSHHSVDLSNASCGFFPSSNLSLHQSQRRERGLSFSLNFFRTKYSSSGLFTDRNSGGSRVKNCDRHVGKSSRHSLNYANYNTDRHRLRRLRDRTKQRISSRVLKWKNTLSLKNRSAKEHLSVHRRRSEIAVTKLRRKLNTGVKENIKTIPNLLTTLRMGSAPVLSYLVVNEHFGLAFSIFVVAGITDLLDGYITRNFKNQRTALGTALDPLADKLLISFLTVSLTSAGLIPVPLTVLILGRDAGLIAGSFYVRYTSLAPPRTLSRYFDVSHVTAKLYPSLISKVNTAFQLSYVACTLASPVFDFVGHPWLQALMYTTATTTFLSGADYVLTWRKRLKIIKNN